MTDTYLSYDELHALLTGVLQAGGYSAAHAAAIAHTMSKAERDQCRSHGIYRLAGVLKSRRAGLATGEKAPVISDAADRPITKIDAGGEFAPLASAQGLPLLAAKARRYGLAALAINNCLHLAALWPEVEALANQGLGALAMCPLRHQPAGLWLAHRRRPPLRLRLCHLRHRARRSGTLPPQ